MVPATMDSDLKTYFALIHGILYIEFKNRYMQTMRLIDIIAIIPKSAVLRCSASVQALPLVLYKTCAYYWILHVGLGDIFH